MTKSPLYRSLNQYSWREWLRFRPISERLKTRRYDRIDKKFIVQPARAGDVAAIVRQLRERDVVITVAFEDLTAIQWQHALLLRFLPVVLHVVVDNSRDSLRAAEIASFCFEKNIPYIRAPQNPWSGSRTSRSHGAVLNWIWHRLILLGQPNAFGFIDDDLFLTAPHNPFNALADRDFDGPIRSIGERWFLWAGYCFFQFDRIKSLPLDFRQAWFLGLDTGGANWPVLYCQSNPSSMSVVRTGEILYAVNGQSLGEIEWVGPWLHEGGTGTFGNDTLFDAKRRRIARFIEERIGTNLESLLAQSSS